MKKQLLTLSLIMMSIGLFSQSTIWQPYNTNLDTAWGTRWISVIDTNTAWAVGEDRTHFSATSIKFTRTQNGINFIPGTFLPDTVYYSSSNISAVNDSVAYIPCYSKDAKRAGIMMKTMNRGLTWTNCVDTTTMFTTSNNFPDWAHFYTNKRGIILGDPNGSSTPYFEIYHTYNGGISWIRVPQANLPTPVSGEYGVTDVVTWYGSKHLWFGTNHGGANAVPNIYRSNDTGHTWKSAPCGGMLAGVSGLAFRDTLNGLAWGQTAATAGKFLLKKTIDGGVTWTTVIQHNNVGTFDISTIPGKNGYMSVGLDSASSAYITSVTYNDGATWAILESGTQEAQRMLQVTMIDSAQGWAGCFSDNTLPLGNNGMDRFGLNHPNSITSIIKVDAFVAYPNPSNGLVSLRLGKVIAGTKITVTDLLGNQIYQKTVHSNNVNQNLDLDFSGVQKGIYLISINTGVSVGVQKLIIE